MRRVGFAAAIVTIFAVNVASAACYGTDTFENCDNSSGNSYTINRFGDTTMMIGGSVQTGNSWSQDLATLGDTTFHNDHTNNGNSWNSADHVWKTPAMIDKAAVPIGSAVSWTGVS